MILARIAFQGIYTFYYTWFEKSIKMPVKKSQAHMEHTLENITFQARTTRFSKHHRFFSFLIAGTYYYLHHQS